MGDFSVSLTSKGTESADKFSAQNITGVNVVWECGNEFKNLLNDAEFNLVASRKAQDAVLKAIKSGSNLVDLTNPDGSPSDGQQSTDNGQQTPSGGNGGNQQTGGNQQSGGGTTDQGGQQTGGDNNTPPAFG